jgi:hypothetical protein
LRSYETAGFSAGRPLTTVVARLLCLGAAVLASAIGAQSADAVGGNYAFTGGTRAERAQVKAALDASLFDWSVVPEQVTIRIAPGLASSAEAGTIELDSGLLHAGRFAWGVIQHEYAHEVDFFLLDDAQRATLAQRLGGVSWWQTPSLLAHQALTCESFASTLAWAYWPSPDNVLRPASTGDEASGMSAGDFRALLSRLLGLALPSPRRLASVQRR